MKTGPRSNYSLNAKENSFQHGGNDSVPARTEPHRFFGFGFWGFVSRSGINDSWRTVGKICGLCDNTLVPDCAYTIWGSARASQQHGVGNVPASTRTSSSSFGTAGFVVGMMGCILGPPIFNEGKEIIWGGDDVGSANISLR